VLERIRNQMEPYWQEEQLLFFCPKNRYCLTSHESYPLFNAFLMMEPMDPNMIDLFAYENSRLGSLFNILGCVSINFIHPSSTLNWWKNYLSNLLQGIVNYYVLKVHIIRPPFMFILFLVNKNVDSIRLLL